MKVIKMLFKYAGSFCLLRFFTGFNWNEGSGLHHSLSYSFHRSDAPFWGFNDWSFDDLAEGIMALTVSLGIDDAENLKHFWSFDLSFIYLVYYPAFIQLFYDESFDGNFQHQHHCKVTVKQSYPAEYFNSKVYYCSVVCPPLQGGACWEGPGGPTVALWEPDGSSRREKVCVGEHCQADWGQVSFRTWQLLYPFRKALPSANAHRLCVTACGEAVIKDVRKGNAKTSSSS